MDRRKFIAAAGGAVLLPAAARGQIITPQTVALLGAGPVAAAGNFSLLNPATKGASVTIFGGGLAFKETAGGDNVRSVNSFSSGTKKFEITFGLACAGNFGICDATFPSNSFFGNDHAFGITNTGSIIGVGASGSPTVTNGDTIAVEFDAGTGNVWYVGPNNTRYTCGNLTGNGHINPSAPFFFGAEMDVSNATGWTFNFGSSAWVRLTQAGFVGI